MVNLRGKAFDFCFTAHDTDEASVAQTDTPTRRFGPVEPADLTGCIRITDGPLRSGGFAVVYKGVFVSGRRKNKVVALKVLRGYYEQAEEKTKKVKLTLSSMLEPTGSPDVPARMQNLVLSSTCLRPAFLWNMRGQNKPFHGFSLGRTRNLPGLPAQQTFR